MPWREVSVMGERREFVRLAMHEGANRRELYRRFGISHTVGYKWLGRFAGGEEDLVDRSRRPHTSPARSEAATEAAVLSVRDAHPTWGARKIARCLAREGLEPPASSTVHAILVRQGRVSAPAGTGGRPYQRFEKETPNRLWQMDFKGSIALTNGTRCHPLTMVDDHSRYALCLAACGNEQSRTVQGRLQATFRCYGLPDAMFVDNGTPWGDASGARWTRLGVWLLKLGVGLIHSRPYHPQSRGKNERFHRTLKAEVFNFVRFHDLGETQAALDRWRTTYNLDRPHEALGLDVPANRYRPSTRAMPEHVPVVTYDEGEIVRRVPTSNDYVCSKGRRWKVPQAFRGEPVAIRPLDREGLYGIFFAAHEIATIDLTKAKSVSDVSEHVSAMSPG